MMEWVLVYLIMTNQVPVLHLGQFNHETREACVDAASAGADAFWCVPRNWLEEKSHRRPIQGWVPPS